jgi:hypothetical protein
VVTCYLHNRREEGEGRGRGEEGVGANPGEGRGSRGGSLLELQEQLKALSSLDTVYA